MNLLFNQPTKNIVLYLAAFAHVTFSGLSLRFCYFRLKIGFFLEARAHYVFTLFGAQGYLTRSRKTRLDGLEQCLHCDPKSNKSKRNFKKIVSYSSKNFKNDDFKLLYYNRNIGIGYITWFKCRNHILSRIIAIEHLNCGLVLVHSNTTKTSRQKHFCS